MSDKTVKKEVEAVLTATPNPPEKEPEEKTSKDRSCKYCYGGMYEGVGNGCTCPE